MRKFQKQMANFGRLLFVVVILISAFTFAMFQGGQVSWTIFYAILPFTLYSIALFFYPLSDFTVERTIQTPAVERGGKLVVVITLLRKMRFPLLYTVVSEKWGNGDQPKLSKLVVFGFRKKVEWVYEVEEIPRGEHVMEGIEIELTDFFGWIQKKSFNPIRNTVLVFPKTAAIDYVPIDTQYDQGTASSPFSIIKDTTLATGIRDYQAGDRVSWIHWKSYARTQTLMTKEFEDRSSQELLLILDARPSELFEEQIEFVASILSEGIKQQATISLLSMGDKEMVFPSIQSGEQFNNALAHLAKVKPTANVASVEIESSKHLLQRSGSIILITGSPDPDFIESVVKHTKTMKSLVCFAITKKGIPDRQKFLQDVELARKKGVTVQALTQEQFSQVFKEVERS